MKRVIKLATVYMAMDLAAAAVKAIWRRAQKKQEMWGGEPGRE